jgi:hypothetical protein
MVAVQSQPTREKPPYTAPCNHCGLCCTRKPCNTAILLFKSDAGPCPALQWTADGGSACGLMVDPARYAPTRARIKGITALREAMMVAQAAGAGCTMPDPGQPTDWEWRKSIRATAERLYKARKTWGLPTDATPSLMDRDGLRRVLAHIGRQVAGLTTLCVIGSAPGILLGQPGRQTQDIDLWGQESDYDEAELRRACKGTGLEMYVDNEKHRPDRDSYIEVIEPGVSVRIRARSYLQVIRRCDDCAVDLPDEFPVLTLGDFGQLLVIAPTAPLLAALKLARGKRHDIEDAQWLATARGLSRDAILTAVATLPKSAAREAAVKHLARLSCAPLTSVASCKHISGKHGRVGASAADSGRAVAAGARQCDMSGGVSHEQ